jgi:hypothetical protein
MRGVRLLSVSIAAVAFALGACQGDNSSGGWGVGPYACGQYTTCGTCTPVPGCGWCYDSNGTGQCVAGPDQCATPAFSWTWNPSGCRVPADASTGPVVVVPPSGPSGEPSASPPADGSLSSPSSSPDAETSAPVPNAGGAGASPGGW